jgi:hypothetical protein
VIYSLAGTISQKKLENPAGFGNNGGENTSSLFQNQGAFECVPVSETNAPHARRDPSRKLGGESRSDSPILPDPSGLDP